MMADTAVSAPRRFTYGVLAFDGVASFLQDLPHAIAEIPLQFDAIIYHRAAGAAGALQILA